tara:strand:+ start:1165 stop:1434 length:270 start_codon:yes stop_codon:yes gene_type:complete
MSLIPVLAIGIAAFVFGFLTRYCYSEYNKERNDLRTLEIHQKMRQSTKEMEKEMDPYLQPLYDVVEAISLTYSEAAEKVESLQEEDDDE